MATNLELAKKASIENLSKVSESKFFDFGSDSFPILENEFKYKCGIIVNVENKKVRNDWTISYGEAKRVVFELLKLGYTY